MTALVLAVPTDREAMIAYENARPVGLASVFVSEIRDGDYDDDDRVQAFALCREAERNAIASFLDDCAAEADRQAELFSVAGKAAAIHACREEAKAYRNSARMIRADDHVAHRRT